MAHTAFPSDLVQTQRDWNRTYARLAGDPAHAALLRRRLLWLSSRLLWHPFWRTDPGRSPAARVELRHQARVPETQTEEEGSLHDRSQHRDKTENLALHHVVDRRTRRGTHDPGNR